MRKARFKHSEATLTKMRLAAKQRRYNAVAKNKYSLAHQNCKCHHGERGGQNKGKTWTHSAEAKARLAGRSSNFKGKKHSLESRTKLSLARIGKTAKGKNPNWKGGISGTERHRLMGEAKYKNWRNAVFAKDNYTCQICDDYGGYLHADHIKGWSEYPNLRYQVSNGRTLCRACHYYITFKNKLPSNSLWGLTAIDRKRG